MAILTDNFNDNSRDTVKWSLGSIAFENAGVGVAEANQQLEITPLANEAAAAIYGYQSASTCNFTGAEARITLAADFGAPSEAWLVVVLDADNYLRIHAVGGGNLFTRSRVAAGNNNVDHGAFSFATHTHWKIRHDKAADQIVWEYSADGSTWTELRRIARPFAITSLTVYLSGGSAASSATPPVIKFDDFSLQIPGGAALLRGRSAPFFDDEEVNRFEFWPVAAPAVEEFERQVALSASASVAVSGQFFSIVERSAAISATATITTVSQSFTTLERAVAVSATGAVESAGARLVERSASLAATGSITSAGEFLSVFERSAAIAATGSITTSAEFFSTLERSAVVSSTTAVTVSGARVVDRTVSVSSTAGITASGESFTLFESAAALSATATIATTGTSFSVLERSASPSTTASVTANGLRIIERAASVTATVTVESSGESFSLVERVVALSATGAVTATAEFFSTIERQVAITATSTIASTRQAELSRQVSLSGSSSIAVTGGILGGVFEHERSAALSAVGEIVTAATVISVVSRAAALSASTTVSTSALTERTRAASLTAVGVVTTGHQRELSRAISLTASTGLAASGITEGAAFNRAVSFSAVSSITVTHAVQSPAPPRRTFVVESSQRTVVVKRELREFKPAPESRESVVQ